jgi:hypothetical protein
VILVVVVVVALAARFIVEEGKENYGLLNIWILYTCMEKFAFKIPRANQFSSIYIYKYM